MSASREDQLRQILRNLLAGTPDIEGAAVISMDGLILSSSLPPTVEEDRVSAMTAAMYGIGSRTAEELARGEAEQVYIRGKDGYLLITQAGNEAVLSVMANGRAKLGIVLLDVRKAAGEVGKIV